METTEPDEAFVQRADEAAVAAAPEQARVGGGQRRTPLSLQRDGGMLFVNVDGSLGGALRFDGETYQCTAGRLQSKAGRAYWVLAGQGDRGGGVEGYLFQEPGGIALTGRLQPRISGRLATLVGGVRSRLAGWVRTSELRGRQYYAMKVTPVPDPGLPLFAPGEECAADAA